MSPLLQIFLFSFIILHIHLPMRLSITLKKYIYELHHDILVLILRPALFFRDVAAVVDENEDDVEGKNKTVFNLNLPFHSFLFYNDSVYSFSFFYSCLKNQRGKVHLSFSISFGSSASLCSFHLQLSCLFSGTDLNEHLLLILHSN